MGIGRAVPGSRGVETVTEVGEQGSTIGRAVVRARDGEQGSTRDKGKG